MKLEYIKTEQCPICGCTEVVKEFVEHDGQTIRTHCNGTRWEHRQFLCGLEMCFVPNFMKETVEKNCNNDPCYLARLKKAKEDKEKLLAFCRENDIQDAIVNKVKSFVV